MEADQVTENPNEGADTLTFAYLTTSVMVNLGSTLAQPVHTNRTLKLNSAVVFEHLTGGSGADTLFGNSLGDSRQAMPATISFLEPVEMICCTAADNDTYIFVPTTVAEADTVSEKSNQGIDTLNFGYLTSGVVVNLGINVSSASSYKIVR